MKIGLHVPAFAWPGGVASIGLRLAEIGRAADEAGFASLWVMDHLVQIPQIGPQSEPMLECYTALGYLAAATRRVQIGALATNVANRHPALLVKAASTLDVLSGGRSYLGIGAGWFEAEAIALGLPNPPRDERFERLEETLQIVHRMWSGSGEPYAGKHYGIPSPLNRPEPLTEPHPPILIAGMGERRTLRLVAENADACNLIAYAGPQILRRKLEILKQHCEAVGRPFDEIERTALGGIHFGPDAMSAQQVIAYCGMIASAGIQHLILAMPDIHDVNIIEELGRQVIPNVAHL
jgi:F420-dependent oxidoreductase-like protein